MTETRVIRYRTKLECADENARLIESPSCTLQPSTVSGIL